MADFNGDGIADISVANYYDGNVSVLLGNGKGAFGSAIDYGVSGGPIAIIAGDFNGDGRADLAAAASGQMSVLLALPAHPHLHYTSVFVQSIRLRAGDHLDPQA